MVFESNKNISYNKVLHRRFLRAHFLTLVTLVVINLSASSQTTKHDLLELSEIYNSEEELYRKYEELEKGSTSNVVNRQQLKLQSSPNSRMANALTIPEELNTIIFSPNKEYFIAYEEQESATPFIFFYKADGKLLKKVEVNIYPNVKYSQNGEYVEVFNTFGREFMVYTKDGDLLQNGDYIELIKDNQEILYNLFVSNDGKNVLMSTSSKVHFFSINKQKLWDHPSSAILECQFTEEAEIVSLKVANQTRDKKNPFSLSILSKSNGQLLDSLSKASTVSFIKSKVIVGKNSKFYEYKIKC